MLLGNNDYSAKVRRTLVSLGKFRWSSARTFHEIGLSHRRFVAAVRKDFEIEEPIPSISLQCVLSLEPRQEGVFGDIIAFAKGLVVYSPFGMGTGHEPALLVRNESGGGFEFIGSLGHSTWRIGGCLPDLVPEDLKGCRWFYIYPQVREDDLMYGFAPERWALMEEWLHKFLPPDLVFK